MPRYFLIGMPFAGKSYWGRLVAAHRGVPFIDLDEYIVQCAGGDIPHLFATLGESGFRKLERKCLEAVIATAPEGSIIACGGGTPCYFDNMKLLKQAGTVLYLEAPVAWLVANSRKSLAVRPLITPGGDLSGQLQQLLEVRQPIYATAHYILQAEDISLTTFDKTCILE